MSDKYCGLYVSFGNEISEEYLEIVKKMIMSIKGVIEVKEKVADMDYWMAVAKAKLTLREKLLEMLNEDFKVY
jgi:hypothetical protein